MVATGNKGVEDRRSAKKKNLAQSVSGIMVEKPGSG